jgi:predicted DNA-binding transcriptional regulator YafY
MRPQGPGTLAGFGDDVEVVAPDEVRTRLDDIGRRLTALYGRST